MRASRRNGRRDRVLGGERAIALVGLPYARKYGYVAAALRRRGVATVQFAFADDASNSPVGSVDGIDLRFRHRSAFADAFTLARFLIRTRPAHLQVSFNAPRVLPAVILARLTRTPIVVACQGGEIQHWERLPRRRRLVFRFCFRAARLVLVNELYMEEKILHHRIADAERLKFVHSSIPVRSDVEVERAKPIVLFLNGFKRWRHPELLVEAAPAIVDGVPGVEIRLVGELPSATGERDTTQEAIRRRVVELGVAGNVRVLPYSEKPSIHLACASVFVLPADVVFCNFALLEAMERGVPAVVADVEGADLIVEHDVSGFVVGQTPDALADAVIRLLADEDRRAAMGRAAHARVAERFDVEDVADDLLRAYETRVWR